VEDEHFSQEGDFFYRNGKVYRDIIDRMTGNCVEKQLIRTNHARVMYELPSSESVTD